MTYEIPSNLNGMALTPRQQSISHVWFPVDALAPQALRAPIRMEPGSQASHFPADAVVQDMCCKRYFSSATPDPLRGLRLILAVPFIATLCEFCFLSQSLDLLNNVLHSRSLFLSFSHPHCLLRFLRNLLPPYLPPVPFPYPAPFLPHGHVSVPPMSLLRLPLRVENVNGPTLTKGLYKLDAV